MFHAWVMRPEQNDFSVPITNDSPQHPPHHITPTRYALTDEPNTGSLADASSHELTRRLRVSTPEELLAYVQSTLGFRPTDSLVMVAFAQRQLSTVVRCDLPEALDKMLQSDTLESVTFFDFGITETQEQQLMELGKYLGQLMAREPSTTGCLLVYMATEVSVSNSHALAVTDTVNGILTAQFGLQGVPIEESWLIHHDQLWHLRCAVTTDCKIRGEVLNDPESTELFQELDPQGQTRSRPQGPAQKLIFPPTLSASSKDVVPTQELLEQRPKVVLNWLQRWDEHLGQGPQMLHTDQVAELLSAIEHPRLRDAVLAVACFDVQTAIRGMLALEQFPNQLALVAGEQSNMQDGLATRGCLLGESDRIPDWQRIAVLERLCHQLLPLADHRSGGGLSGMLVWIEWVRGRGSLALDYLRQARKHFPTEQILIGLENVLRNGRVAAWATRAESAWSPRNAA